MHGWRWEKVIGRGSGFVAVEIPFTPRAKRVLELSLEEARQLGHNYIGTEHLLLGLIREGEGVAARVLENLGVDLAKVRTQVIRMLGGNCRGHQWWWKRQQQNPHPGRVWQQPHPVGREAASWIPWWGASRKLTG